MGRPPVTLPAEIFTCDFNEKKLPEYFRRQANRLLAILPPLVAVIVGDKGARRFPVALFRRVNEPRKRPVELAVRGEFIKPPKHKDGQNDASSAQKPRAIKRQRHGRLPKNDAGPGRDFCLIQWNMPAYRPNVAFILRNAAGEILVCERSDWAGCWQFPQGGVKKGETLLEALHREVEEELGLKPDAYRILTSKGPYRYLFADNRKKQGFDGQEQHYFLGELARPHINIRFDGAHEFRAARWLAPSTYNPDWIAPMKREVYAAVFRDFFGHEFAGGIAR